IVVVDQQSALDYTSDMFDTHMPNDSGYQKMAETWLDALTSGAPGMLEGCASPPLRFVIQ
ncbi:MAG: hypothetical protein ACR2RB_04535, partial [Gammaproteobacteria bacterium]